MKFQRQAKILSLIEEKDIETQEELTAELRAVGHMTTQATVSRDIKELRLVKTLSSETGHYRYSAHQSGGTASAENYQSRLRNIFRESVTNVIPAQNLAVIKTLPGLAQAAAMAIDAMRVPGVVGTLGGDDTVLCVMTDSERAAQFCGEAMELLK